MMETIQDLMIVILKDLIQKDFVFDYLNMLLRCLKEDMLHTLTTDEIFLIGVLSSKATEINSHH